MEDGQSITFRDEIMANDVYLQIHGNTSDGWDSIANKIAA